MTRSTGPSQRSQRLAADRLDRYRAYGAFGKPVFQSHVQLAAMLRSRKGDKVARYFAHPVYNEDTGELQWHTDLVGEVRAWSTMAAEEQARLALNMEVVRSTLAGMIRDLRASPDRGAQGGGAAYANLLEQALKVPASGEFLYFVGDQPVSVFWGFQDSDGRSVDSTAVTVPRYSPLPAGGPATRVESAPEPIAPTPMPPVGDPPPRRPWWWWLLLLPLLALLLWWFLPPGCMQRDGLPVLPPSAEPPLAVPAQGPLPPGHPCAVSLDRIKADPALAAQCADIVRERRTDWSSTGLYQGSSTSSRSSSSTSDSTTTRDSGSVTGSDGQTPGVDGKVPPVAPAGSTPLAGDKPADQPGDKPGDDPGAKPGEMPGDKPGERPADKPGEPPVDKPGDKPGELPGPQPNEKPGDKSVEKPTDQPGQKPGDKPGDAPPLQLPTTKPGAAGAQDLGFLQGNWSPGFPMQDPTTGQPLDVNLEFDKGGKGQFVVKRPDGTACRGDIAGQMAGGRLSIAGAGQVQCPGGASFAAPQIDCENDGSGRTNCTGRNPDGSRFHLPLTRR